MRRDDCLAVVGGRLATDLADVTADPSCLDGAGFWVAVVTFEGQARFARFADVRPAPSWAAPALAAPPWRGPTTAQWTTSLDRGQYVDAVREVRAQIAAGEVYQVNVCRVLSARSGASTLRGLSAALAVGNPAPHQALIELPDLSVACASPELFLRRRGRRVQSRPIKGTAREPGGLSDKDRAENVMIVDLVRNDLSRVAVAGSVTVPILCAVEPHPGLVHLVSTVDCELEPDVGWADLLAATSPPGSVSGAPKSSALRLISELEPEPRGPYCGAVGWVDADQQQGELAVGIRTFWLAEGLLRFGTGAGITWGSDPAGEWDETELKAARLLAVATGGIA